MAAKKATTATAIDWKKLKHANGPATRVPKLIADLTAKDDEERDAARTTLDEVLTAPGQWFSASAPTAALLCDVLDSANKHRAVAGQLLADVVAGQHLHGLANPDSLKHKDAKTVHSVIAARATALINLLDSDNGAVRSAVAQVLAFTPDLLDRTLPPLRTRLAQEQDAGVRASLLLATATLGRAARASSHAKLLNDARRHDSPLVRGAAALGILLLEPSHAFGDVAADVDGLLREEPGPTFGWGNGSPAGLIGAVLAPRPDTLDVLLSLDIVRALPRARGELAGSLLALSGMKEKWREEDVALPEELSPVQRRVAEALARVDGVPDVGWGIPASGRVRRRWLGLAPAGPLEKPIAAKGNAPLWKVWRAEYARAKAGIPDVAQKQLTPMELAEAVAEVALNAYGINTAGKPEPRELFLLAESVGAKAADWAQRFGHEMLPYFDGTMTPENGTSLSPGAWRYLVFVPMLRAGQPIPDEFAIYTPPVPEALWRESLKHLSPEGRERAVLERLAWTGAGVEDRIDQALVALDLVPSHRVAALLATRLLDDEIRDDIGEDEADERLARLAKLAKKVPAIRDGLAEARKQVER